MAQLDQEIKTVESKAIVDLNRLFNRLEVNPGFPVFIYENGEVIYWSTNRFVPKYGTLEGLYYYKYLEINGEKFVVRKRSINSAQNRIVEIYGFLPLETDVPITEYFDNTGLNEKIFGRSNYLLSSNQELPENNHIKSRQGIYLFSFTGSDLMKVNYPVYSTVIVLMFTLCIFLFVRAAFFYAGKLVRNDKPLSGLALLSSMLFVLRVIMIRYDFPYSVKAYGLFDPVHFAANYFEASLGDLILNQISLLIVVIYGFVMFQHKALGNRYSWGFIGLILLSVLSFYYFVFDLKSLLENSQWELDITKDNNLTTYKLISYFSLFIQGVTFFLITQLAAIRYMNIERKQPFRIILIAALGLGVIASLLLSTSLSVYAVIYLVYFIVIVRLKFPSEIYRLSYNTFLYFFTASFVVALASTLVLSEDIRKVDRQDKVSISTELLTNNDFNAEYLLSVAMGNIEEDILIQTNISSPFSPKQLIKQRIRRSYLGDYFDKYDIEIMLFSGSGKPINNPQPDTYGTLMDRYAQSVYGTQVDDLYFLSSKFPTVVNQYYAFIDIKRYDTLVGHIVINLVKKEQLQQ